MMVKASNVIGLKIFSVDEGKEVDTVEDVIYNPSARKIEALIADTGGIFSSGKVVAIEDVESIGEDAVIIKSESVMRSTKDLADDVRHIAKDDTYLTKSRVMTEQGNDLGKVSDLMFDPKTGEVVELEVTQGGLRDLQSGRKLVKLGDITTVGEDALIVKSFTETSFDEQAEAGGMKGWVNEAKNAVGEATEDATRQAHEQVDQARQKWDSPEVQGKIQRAKEDVQSYTEEGKKRLQAKADEAKTKFEQAKEDPENRQKMGDMQDRAQDLAASAKDKAHELTDTTRSTIADKKQDYAESKENEAVGQYITRNVLDQSDSVIAARGDVVTHNILDSAKKAGVEDVVLSNLSQQPLGQSAGTLGGEVKKQSNTNDQLEDDLSEER